MNSTIQLIHLTVRFEREEQARRDAFVRQHDDLAEDKPANQVRPNARKEQSVALCFCPQKYGIA